MSYVKFVSKIEGKPFVSKPKATYDFSCVGGIRLSSLRDFLGGDIESLWRAFSWSSTPQGHRYWNRIAQGRSPMLDEDIEFCEGLLEYIERST